VLDSAEHVLAWSVLTGLVGHMRRTLHRARRTLRARKIEIGVAVESRTHIPVIIPNYYMCIYDFKIVELSLLESPILLTGERGRDGRPVLTLPYY
jgi:hypothetical protein